MTSNKSSFLNTPPVFINSSSNIWQVKFKFFIQTINLEFRETIINGPFNPTYQVNRKVIDKLYSLRIKEEKRKFEIGYKLIAI